MKPIRCPDCGAIMILRDENGRHFWGCRSFPKCRATVAAREDGSTIARPGDRETRAARRRCHLEIDLTSRRLDLERGLVYLMLSRLLDIPAHECHVGIFSKARCFEAIRRLEKATHDDAAAARRKGA